MSYQPPYRKQLPFLNGQQITSLVMDQCDFDKLLDMIATIKFNSQLVPVDSISRIRAAKHLPLMARGTKTEIVFDQFDVTTDLLCAIVRGHGPKLLDDLLDG